MPSTESRMVIDLPRWENHRHKKGAEIVNRAGPYGAGPWLELGSGIGNNTFPLSEKVGLVIALDMSSRDLMAQRQKKTEIYPLQADFQVRLPIRTDSLGGIFSSFSLHFVKEPALVFREVGRVLRPGGTFILVEYQTSKSVPWIPFPLPKKSALRLLYHEGFESIKSLHETSRYFILRSRKSVTPGLPPTTAGG
ncbi:MAG: class I SAM-dependent methyltransferase [Candidatus Heimdallarchaeota archaeon]